MAWFSPHVAQSFSTMKRFSGRRKVLFSDKHGWEKDIRRRINAWRYAPFFKSFSEADLDAFDVLIPQHLTDIVFLNENHAELCLHEFEESKAS